MMLYIIAGYIRLYGFNPKFKTKHYVALFFASALITYLLSFTLTILSCKIGACASYVDFFDHRDKVPVLLMTTSLFMIFATLKMNYYRWINVIASATFGVYLIHEQPVVRDFLWLKLFQNAKYQDSVMLIPYSIAVCVIVYTVCTLLDLLRQFTVEKLLVAFINSRFLAILVKPFESAIDVFKNIVFGKEQAEVE